MTLTGDQEIKLSSAHQRCKCRIVAFDTLAAVNLGEVSTGAYTFKDMVNIHPRYSWCEHSATIRLYATDSQQRASKVAATGHTFSLVSGSGSIVDNGNGTCDYTAPASGAGVAYIKCVTDGNADPGGTAGVAYGTESLNVGEIVGFSASLSSGFWELTVRAYGDCTGLERQKGVLLCCDDYWSGSEDTFGGYVYHNGVMFGWVDRMRTVYQDSDNAYLEVRIVSALEIMNKGSTPDCLFSASDTSKVQVTGFEAIDAAWIFIQNSGLNSQVNFHFMDDGNTVTNLKLEKGPFTDVIRDVVARTFGVVFSSKLGDVYLVGDPDVRNADFSVAGINVSEHFQVDEKMIRSSSMTYHKVTNLETPSDATVRNVLLEAIKSNLDNITASWPETPQSGLSETVSGLICESENVLQDWATDYWWKVNRHLEADLEYFLMHHVDLGTFLGWDLAIRAADLSNYDWYGDFTRVYVSDINYTVEPGMGLWSGSVHVLSYYDIGS